MSAMGGLTSAAMIGRQAELDLLVAAFGRVRVSGRPALVLIAGEAGIGKTRMIEEFGEQVAGADGLFLVGRCLQFGEHVLPLAPLRDLLEVLVETLDTEVLDLVIGPARDGLSDLVPELG